MKTIERLEASLAGERVDRFPFTFYQELPLQHCEGELVAGVVQDFAERFQLDLVVVPHVYSMPVEAELPMQRAQDLGSLQVVHARNGGWGKQMTALARVSRANFQKRWVVQEVPSPWAMLCRLAGLELVQRARTEHPGFVRQALDVLAESLASFARASLEAGAQGILYGLEGAGFDHMTASQAAEWIHPRDRKVLQGVSGATCNILHLRGRRQHLQDLGQLGAPVVGWEVGAGPPLLKVRSKWTGCYYGGLEAGRVGTERAEALLREALGDVPPSRLILAPDGPVHGSLRLDVLEELSHALQSYQPGPRVAPPKPPRAPRPPRPREERPAPPPPTPLQLPKGVRTRVRPVQDALAPPPSEEPAETWRSEH